MTWKHSDFPNMTHLKFSDFSVSKFTDYKEGNNDWLLHGRIEEWTARENIALENYTYLDGVNFCFGIISFQVSENEADQISEFFNINIEVYELDE